LKKRLQTASLKNRFQIPVSNVKFQIIIFKKRLNNSCLEKRLQIPILNGEAAIQHSERRLQVPPSFNRGCRSPYVDPLCERKAADSEFNG
jgi:hypothetical protein